VLKGEGGKIWWQYFVFIYENEQMRPVETVLKGGGRHKEERWRG
jgi:hypothetical protein